MKARVKATGEIVEVERVSKNIFGRTDGIVAMYSKDVLDFNLNPPHPQATISGWVARDSERAGNGLYFHRNEVTRGEIYWKYKDLNRPIGKSLILPEDLFPSLTWQDEPIEVEITIKPKI